MRTGLGLQLVVCCLHLLQFHAQHDVTPDCSSCWWIHRHIRLYPYTQDCGSYSAGPVRVSSGTPQSVLTCLAFGSRKRSYLPLHLLSPGCGGHPSAEWGQEGPSFSHQTPGHRISGPLYQYSRVEGAFERGLGCSEGRWAAGIRKYEKVNICQ